MPDTPANPSQRYLDPFVFPSETDTLFTLLTIAAMMIAANLGVLITLYFTGSTGTHGTTLALLVGIFLVIFTAAFISYRAYPRYSIWKNGLEPFENAGFSNALAERARGAGLSAVPTTFRQRTSSSTALAFGAGSGNYLRLDSGLLVMQVKDPKRFWAKVLHELAHFRNNDISRYFFSKTLTGAVTALLIVPFVLLISGSFVMTFASAADPGGKTRIFLMLTIQTLAVFACFVLVQAKLLRVREYYADYRAAAWGAREPLTKILSEEDATNDEAGFFTRLNRFHPSAMERLASLEDRTAIFRLGKGLPFIASILLTMLMQGAVVVVILILFFLFGVPMQSAQDYITYVNDTGDKSDVYAVGFLVQLLSLIAFGIIFGTLFFLVYKAVRSVALQLVRESVADLVTAQHRSLKAGRLLVLALVIAAGYEIGYVITPMAFLTPESVEQLGSIALWFFPTLVLIWLSLLFTRYFAQGLFGRHIGARVPKWRLRILLVAVALLFSFPFFTQILVRLGPLLKMTAQGNAVFGNFVTGTFVFTLFAYAALFVFMLVVSVVIRVGATSTCANCRAPAGGGTLLGRFCAKCGGTLSEWIFLKEEKLL